MSQAKRVRLFPGDDALPFAKMSPASEPAPALVPDLALRGGPRRGTRPIRAVPIGLEPREGEVSILGIRHRVRIWTAAQWAMLPDGCKPEGAWDIDGFRFQALPLMPDR